MRNRLFVILLSGVMMILWGCSEKKQAAGPVAGERLPVLDSGTFHNDVLAAVDRDVPLDGVSGMTWDTWLEMALRNLESVSAEHGIPFDRDRATAEIMALAGTFTALKDATGIDPGMLGESEDPKADLARLIAELRQWDAIDEQTTQVLWTFVEHGADRAAALTTDPGLRDVIEIGEASRRFWVERATREPEISQAPGGTAMDEEPCKKCVGRALSDTLGGLTGYLVCGGDPACRALMAASASFVFDLATNHCATHNCYGDGFMPPGPILP